MKILAGKYYKMRNGDKAYVGYYSEEYSKDFPYIGYNQDDEMGGVISASWNTDGIDFEEPECDLISEWQEQETINVGDIMYRCVVRNDDGGLHTSNLCATIEIAKKRAVDFRYAKLVAIMRSHEWEACKRGDRELVIGEGI